MIGDLTPRQQQVIALLEKGTTTRQLAGLLHISEATARNHVQAILTAMEAPNRLAAVYQWKQLQHPAERILRYCHHAGIRVTDKQADIIRTAFAR